LIYTIIDDSPETKRDRLLILDTFHCSEVDVIVRVMILP
jgi:hypothetical protein